MKKNLIALMLSIVMVVGGVSGSSVFAAETTAQEASEITQEEVELEEVPEESEETDEDISAEDTAEVESAQMVEEELVLEEDEEPEDDSEIAEEQDEYADTAVTAEMPHEEVKDDQVDISEIPADISGIEEPVVIEEETVTAEENEAVGDAIASGTCGDNLTWVLEEEGTLTISGTGDMKDYNHYTGGLHNYAPWYEYRTQIIKVVIQENVTSIGYEAFEGLTALTEVMVPSSATRINTRAFFNCTSLENVIIPDGVTSLESHAFCGCSSLESIKMPDSVTTIGSGVFHGCTSLTELTIPNSVTEIGYNAFYSCTALKKIQISNSVASIKSYLFFNCTSLENVIIPDGVTSIESYAFADCSSLKSITIPDSVTIIRNGAFLRCSSLTSITIPKNVKSVGTSTSAWSDKGSVFKGCSSLTSVMISEGVTSIWEYAFDGCSSLTSVTIPKSVTSIEDHAFSGCTSLTEVTIPDNVTSIGDYAFSDCTSLTEMTIPENVTSLGFYAFYDCSNLASVTIGKGVTSIEYGAFYGCSILIVYTENEYVIEYCKSNKIMCNVFDHFFLINEDANDYQHKKLPYNITDTTLLDKLYYSVRASWGKTRQIVRLLKNQESGGVCHGTSMLMCYGQQGLVDLKTINPDAEYYRNLGDPSDDYEGNSNNNTVFRNMLVYYQLLQLSDDCSESKKIDKGGWFSRSSLDSKMNDFMTYFINEAKRATRENKPFLFSFSCSGKYDHCVVVCGYRWRSSDNTHIIYIYDLNDRYNYKEMEIPKNCTSFTFVDANGKAVHNTWKSIGYYGIDRLYKSNYIVKTSSATSNQASYTASNQSTSPTTFCISEGKTFKIENDKGEWLSYDGTDYKGNMEVLDCYTSGMEDYVYWNITINPTSKLILKDFEPECELIAQIDGQGYSVLSDNADSITIQSDGVSAEGSDYRLEVAVQSNEHDALVVKTSAKGTTTVTSDNEQLTVTSTGGCTDTSAWIQDGLTTKEIRVREDDNNHIDIDFNNSLTDISECSLNITDSVLTYNGQAQIPALTIKDGNYTLVEGNDYYVTGSNNINPGTASMTITGIGNYTCTVTKTFLILLGKTTRGDMFNLANNVKVTWKEVPGAKYYKVYRNGVSEPVIVTDRLVGWDTCTTPKLEPGKIYTYKIVASLTGKGESSGDSTLSYSKSIYRLQTTAFKYIKNTAPGKVTVSYKKSNYGDSYVILYADNKDMKNAKSKVIYGADTTAVVLGGFKKGKTYWFQIRVRKNISGYKLPFYTTFGVQKSVKITQ